LRFDENFENVLPDSSRNNASQQSPNRIQKMSRWIRPQQLITVGITIQEQIEWAELGLSVYDTKGRRIIEYEQKSILPSGCKYLTSTDFFYAGDTFQYCRWNETHEFFTKFQFSRDELVQFLQAPKPLLPREIANELSLSMSSNQSDDDIINKIEHKKKNSPPLLNSIYTPGLGQLLGIQPSFSINTPTQAQQINTDNHPNDAITPGKGQQDTSKATEGRAIKTALAWALDLEIAVALAVECAELQKPKSTEQHRTIWKKRCSEKGIHSPRKEAFAAFRRGLPAHLKMEKS
jgi:hypothetical protein